MPDIGPLSTLLRIPEPAGYMLPVPHHWWWSRLGQYKKLDGYGHVQRLQHPLHVESQTTLWIIAAGEV
jgi:hypothetical protein